MLVAKLDAVVGNKSVHRLFAVGPTSSDPHCWFHLCTSVQCLRYFLMVSVKIVFKKNHLGIAEDNFYVL